jgi:selenocysteine lyase/cysteine desulfurase
MTTNSTVTASSRPRTLAILALTGAMAFGYLIARAQAHDPRLDEAFQALQKAYALVEASQTGGAEDQVQRQFDKHRERALELITRAMEEVVITGNVTDGQ